MEFPVVSRRCSDEKEMFVVTQISLDLMASRVTCTKSSSPCMSVSGLPFFLVKIIVDVSIASNGQKNVKSPDFKKAECICGITFSTRAI